MMLKMVYLEFSIPLGTLLLFRYQTQHEYRQRKIFYHLSHTRMKRILLLVFGISLSGSVFAQCSLSLPAPPAVDSITGCSARLSWKSVPGAAYYQLRYMPQYGSWSELINAGNDTTFSMTGLIPGTKYFVGVAPYCDSSFKRGNILGNTFITGVCEVPVITSTAGETEHSINVTWTTYCSVTSFSIRYRLVSDEFWTELNDVNSPLSIAGLSANSNYEVQLQSVCSDLQSSGWSSSAYGLTLMVIDTTGNNDTSGNNIDTTGNNIDTTGNNIDTTGNNIDTTGNNIDTTGNNIDTTGNNIDTTGNNIDTTGNNIDTTGNNIDTTGNNIDTTGNNIDTTGNNIDTTGNNIDTTGNNIDTTATTQRPNIILIIADDMSQKTFIETGGPTWFETPAISRIANEGINFMEATVTLSLCAPSRATIFTGLYANHTGVTANQGERIDSNLLTMAKVLHDAGYYTGFIGKYHVASMPQPGYDFWLAGVNSFYGNNPKFNLNGNMVTMDENFTTVVQENVNEFIRTAPRPFFLIAAHVAPHAPYLVQPQDEGRYDDEVMPFPQDFYKYTHNFPDFLYPSNQINITDSANLTEDIKGYFESTAGIEHSTDTMLSIMDSLGITDSSMIIFTSDNGYLFGEHQLFCKRLSYEESLKVPMFIRYPQWFTPHTVDTTTLALNVDLCPTILDAAGIPDTFHFDGKSLHYLLQNPAARTQTLFQYDYNSYGDGTNIPSFRGIRSLDYKYVRYSCEDQTEEFFDERNDPLELTNLINDSSYTSLIEHYRHLLDSSMQSLGDTNALVVRNCYLNTTQERVMDSEEGDEEGEAMTFRVYPQPAKDNVFFELRNLPTEQGKITYVINNAKGEFLTRKDLFYVGKNFRDVIDIASLVPGVYMVKISDGMSVFTSKLTVGH